MTVDRNATVPSVTRDETAPAHDAPTETMAADPSRLQPSAYPWIVPVALTLVFTVGAFVRLRDLDARGFWFDEAFVWRLISFSWGEMLERIAQDNTPPLYYIILKLWA